MNVIILLGAPGSGKGTAAERIRKAGGYEHVSTGDLLRAAVKAGSPLGRDSEGYMRRGDLVPDNIMMELVESIFAAGSEGTSYLFDGFPRTVRQAELLDTLLQSKGARISHVVYLEASRDVLLQRLGGRRLCRSCGANYHVINLPPRTPGVCDRCGGELYQRPDDCDATIASRLDVFDQTTGALIPYYTKQGLLRRVDSNAGPDRLAADVTRVLQSA